MSPTHFLLAASLLALASPSASRADEASSAQAIDVAIGKVFPSLVRIHVVSTDYRDGREVKEESTGSGVVISAEGHVITNHHVAGHAVRARCTLADGRDVEATLVGTDALADLAVLKLRDEDLGGKRPPVASFGDSAGLRVGDTVLAMGSPLAFAPSVTRGIVSNVALTLPVALGSGRFTLEGEETGALVKWIGHDAQIFPGNSGGPLVDLGGRIVGINEVSFGLSGAIPGNLARDVADALIKSGSVKRSWIGIDLQPLLKRDGGPGALVSGVAPGSPAEKAGLRAGDVLFDYRGEAVDVRRAEDMPDLNRRLLATPIGETVALGFRRDGKPQRGEAVTVARGTVEGREREARPWGVTFQDISLLAARELARPVQSGVVVSSMRAGSPAADARPPLQPADIVVEVGGVPVKTLDDVMAATEKLTQGATAPRPVLVAFERRQQKLLTVVFLGTRESADTSVEVTKAWLPVAVQVLTPELAEALGLVRRRGRTSAPQLRLTPTGRVMALSLLRGRALAGSATRRVAPAPAHAKATPGCFENARPASLRIPTRGGSPARVNAR